MNSKKKNEPQTVNPAIISQVFRPDFHLRPDTDSSNLIRLKRRFMEIARSVCPGFRILDEHKPVINDIFNWCIMAEGRLNPEKGLWLHGSIGSGKTTMLEIVRRFCHDVRPRFEGNEYSFRTSNAIEVCGEFSQKGFEGIETYITSRRQAFDELGSETIPTGYYGNALNVFQYILQRRYDNLGSSFTHVTTNITEDEISVYYGPRIYDRCKEMFNFVELIGETWRRKG